MMSIEHTGRRRPTLHAADGRFAPAADAGVGQARDPERPGSPEVQARATMDTGCTTL